MTRSDARADRPSLRQARFVSDQGGGAPAPGGGRAELPAGLGPPSACTGPAPAYVPAAIPLAFVIPQGMRLRRGGEELCSRGPSDSWREFDGGQLLALLL